MNSLVITDPVFYASLNRYFNTMDLCGCFWLQKRSIKMMSLSVNLFVPKTDILFRD